MKSPRVAIIVLNWNGWADTIECLESLRRINYPTYNLILVDNGSKDDSLIKIREYCEGKLKVNSNFFETNLSDKTIKVLEYSKEEVEKGVIRDEDLTLTNTKIILLKYSENQGFAEGNNIAMRFALNTLKPKYVLLLNNDTVVDPFFLDELIDIAEKNKLIGFAGPKTYYYDYRGRKDVIAFAGGKIQAWRGQTSHVGQNEIDKGQHNNVTNVEYVEGSCMLARKDLIEDIGLLDPRYFAYWEETDWSARARKAGYKLIYVPKSRIWHKVSSTMKKMKGVREYYMTRNTFWFIKKNAGKSQYLIFLIYFFSYKFWFKSGVHLIYHRDLDTFLKFTKAVRDGLLNESKYKT